MSPIQVYKPVKEAGDYVVKVQSSAGSVENLRKTNAGKQRMSVVYSGHVWLGREGKMKNDPNKYGNVLAVAWLYGAPAQLVRVLRRAKQPVLVVRVLKIRNNRS